MPLWTTTGSACTAWKGAVDVPNAPSADLGAAIWEKGMFAGQNVVAKLRQPFTLQRLTEIFELVSDDAQ